MPNNILMPALWCILQAGNFAGVMTRGVCP
jgi:hypothetical protein